MIDCKVCAKPSTCRLADRVCPYRDIDTKVGYSVYRKY